MAVFKIEKVIGSVPATIEANCLYLVRTGVGFNLYASDATGSIAHSLNGGSGGGITFADFLSLPVARCDFFDHALVIQDGELRRMSYADFTEAVQPGFDPVPYSDYNHIFRLIYDNSPFVFDDVVLYYAEDSVLIYGDDFLLFGDEEELLFSSDGIP